MKITLNSFKSLGSWLIANIGGIVIILIETFGTAVMIILIAILVFAFITSPAWLLHLD